MKRVVTTDSRRYKGWGCMYMALKMAFGDGGDRCNLFLESGGHVVRGGGARRWKGLYV